MNPSNKIRKVRVCTCTCTCMYNNHSPWTMTLSFWPVSSPMAKVCVRLRVDGDSLSLPPSSEYSPVSEPLWERGGEQGASSAGVRVCVCEPTSAVVHRMWCVSEKCAQQLQMEKRQLKNKQVGQVTVGCGWKYGL